MEARHKTNPTNVVFGICNSNFTQFRKMRYFDSKVFFKLSRPYLNLIDNYYKEGSYLS